MNAIIIFLAQSYNQAFEALLTKATYTATKLDHSNQPELAIFRNTQFTQQLQQKSLFFVVL